ncbi:protein translocase subunit SecD [candidate division KSB1 bacterium 4484_87]|nr:MAG: protein translocase subunit SecD [candidate division KSB1 bacterium 4484_87]
MKRKLLSRFIFISVLVLLALWQLYPTYNLSRLNKQQTQNIEKLLTMVDLSKEEIKTALIDENLEGLVVGHLKDKAAEKEARQLAAKIQDLDQKIFDTEKKSIKRGLDLQGGTYLVYEINFPDFLSKLAKTSDEQFQALLKKIDLESKQKDMDFFDVMVAKFNEKNIPLDRYFGKKGDSDNKILTFLRKEAEDAIDRSREVLVNRVDQFGVSEPTIVKQGRHRIVVELAGIQDVNRAKAVIGKTAQLEFKLLRDPDYTSSVLMKIDKVVKSRRQGILDSTKLAEVLQADSTLQDSVAKKKKVRDETEVDLNELFGQNTAGGTKSGDTTLSVDKDMFQENPFLALLGNVGNMVAAPKQNMHAVDVILNYPEVKNVIPKDSQFLWASKPVKVREKEWYFLYFVKKNPELTGDYIDDAQVQVSGGSGNQMTRAGQAEVHLTLNSEGGKKFARITGANVGKFLAIVLDNKVASAPRIKEKIPSGTARIDGLDDIQEAKDLQIVLRAGALPARLESIEERTVGPSLGKDSIHKGQYSAMIGLALVIIFMVIYYKLSGAIADVALILNIIFVMAVLAAFHATLTLPGVAGIILTIGMAVDANVLIFERIREELRSGKTIRAAIDAGYGRAFITILDANITTLLTAIVLYQFGTGPIQGFAVTLMIGIIASMFTAIVVTRFIFDYITSKHELKQLSI